MPVHGMEPRGAAGLRRAALTGGLAALLLLLHACGGDPAGPDTAHPAITTTDLPSAMVGEAYSEGVHVSDGDGEYSWSLLSGLLPPGLALSVDDFSPNEALITGIPTSAGTYSFRIRVEDGIDRADTAQLVILVHPAPEPLIVRTPRLPPALADFPYRVELEAAGGTRGEFAWAVVEGSLPPGLELDAQGRFSGAPTTPDTTTFTVEVTSGEETARATYSLAVAAEDPTRYVITPFPVVDVPESLRDNLAEAIRRWEAAVISDLSSGTLPAGEDAFFEPGDCAGFGHLVNGTAIDDLILLVNIDSIDGVGRILAQAGPCGIRTDTTPFVGILTLDEDDLLAMASEERVTDIIQHEIAHVMGFGTLWELFDVVVGTDTTSNPRYTGASAVAAYQAVVDTATTIPVENQGGDGTRDSHWRTSVFGNEIMTGFASQPGFDMFLSEMTIASFEDLGYTVDRSAADDTPLLGLLGSSLFGEGSDWGDLGYDVAGIPGPIVVWQPETGTYRKLIPTSRSP
jgi:hypothetical protein